jgi:hypothetical protein
VARISSILRCCIFKIYASNQLVHSQIHDSTLEDFSHSQCTRNLHYTYPSALSRLPAWQGHTCHSSIIQPSSISEPQFLSNLSKASNLKLEGPNSEHVQYSRLAFPARPQVLAWRCTSKFPPPFETSLVYPRSSYDDVAHGLHLKVGQMRLRGRL